MEKVYSGTLYLNTLSGGMRLTKGKRSVGSPLEIPVKVRIVVNVPRRVAAEITGTVDIPEAIMKAFVLKQEGDDGP